MRLLDGIRDPRGGAHVDVEVVQVAVVDADDLGSDLERPRELVRVVDLDQRLHTARDRVLVQLGELLVGEHGDDEEDGVGSVDPGLVDLVGVEDEVLAENGRAVGESVNSGADGTHVLEGALEPLGLSEDGDSRGAGESVGEGDGGRGGGGAVDEVALGGRSALDLGKESDMRLAVHRSRLGLESAVEGDEGRGDVQVDERVEVGGLESRGCLGLGHVEVALQLDTLEDGGKSGGRGGGGGGGLVVLGSNDDVRSSIFVARVLFPDTTGEAEEVAEHDLAVLGENRLGMVLDRLEGELAMPESHDDAALGPASNDEVGRKSVEPSGERVIPGRLYILRDVLEDALAVVRNGARLAVHDLAGFVHDSSVGGVHALKSHADSHDGNLADVRLDGRDGDARIALGVAGTGRDDEVGEVWVASLELFERDRLGTNDGYVGAEQAEVLILFCVARGQLGGSAVLTATEGLQGSK